MSKTICFQLGMLQDIIMYFIKKYLGPVAVPKIVRYKQKRYGGSIFSIFSIL